MQRVKLNRRLYEMTHTGSNGGALTQEEAKELVRLVKEEKMSVGEARRAIEERKIRPLASTR